jgi:tetratricopeptide (TPR) repeat protein
MSKKTNDKAEVRVEGVEHALTRAEQFIETHQKRIIWVVGVLLSIVVIYMAFHRFYIEKKSKDASVDMYPAEQYFEKGDWEKALNGDGNNIGFADVISDYRFTPSANLAKYYAGLCCLRLGEYEEAIKYLGNFGSKDRILSSIALGSIGDAFAQLGESGKAVDFYKRAAERKNNDFTSPLYLLRAGILLEKDGKLQEAAEMYERIKTDYAVSAEGRTIDKYIARIKVKQGNN